MTIETPNFSCRCHWAQGEPACTHSSGPPCAEDNSAPVSEEALRHRSPPKGTSRERHAWVSACAELMQLCNFAVSSSIIRHMVERKHNTKPKPPQQLAQKPKTSWATDKPARPDAIIHDQRLCFTLCVPRAPRCAFVCHPVSVRLSKGARGDACKNGMCGCAPLLRIQ